MIRRRVASLALAVVLALCGTTYGQDPQGLIVLDHVDGLYAPGVVPVGQEISFCLRITNNTGEQIHGMMNGFRVHSEDGAAWSSLVGDTLGTLNWGDIFDLVFKLFYFSADGFGADTVGFGGATLFSTGLPAGFDDTTYTITIGPIGTEHHGKHICLDSSFYPPSGYWLWVPAYPLNHPVTPDWDGPHCFVVFHQSGPADIDRLPTSLSYGTVYVGYPVTKSVIIYNRGTEPLTVTGIGSDHPDFSANVTSFELSFGESQEVMVAFAPTSVGVATGVLTIESNDPDEPSVTVSVDGVGELPPMISVSPDSLYEDLDCGEESVQTLRITNVGEGELDFTAFAQGAYTVSGEGDSAHSVEEAVRGAWLEVTPAWGTVMPSAYMDIEVTFDAAELVGGDYEADVVISSNDPGTPVVLVPVHLSVTGMPSIFVPTQVLNFDQAFFGDSVVRQFSVYNDGGGLLEVYDVSCDNPDYTVDTTHFSIDPASAQIVVVTFTPSTLGVIMGTLTITSNDPEEPTVTVVLQGECVLPPIISVFPESFGDTLIPGEVSSQLLSISNTGGSDLGYRLSVRKPRAGAALFAVEAVDSVLLELDPMTGDVMNSFPLPENGLGCAESALAFDGTYLYYAAVWADDVIYRLHRTTGQVLAAMEIPSVNQITGLGHSGDALYALQEYSTVIFKIDFDAGAIIDQHDFGILPLSGISYGGNRGTIFVCGQHCTVHEIDPDNWVVVNSFTVPDLTMVEGLGYSDELGLLFIGCGTHILGVDPDAGVVVSSHPLEEAYSVGLAADETPGPAWFRVEPFHGTVPLGSTDDIEVTFDAREFAAGDYQANLAVFSNDPSDPLVEIPVALVIRDVVGGEAAIEPDTIPVYYANAITPFLATMYLGNFDESYEVSEIDVPTLRVNAATAPVACTILPSYPGFMGEVMEFTFPVAGFIEGYGPMYDTTVRTLTVTGYFDDLEEFGVCGEVAFIGHACGDINADGVVADIADLVCLVDFMFAGGAALPAPMAADVDGSGGLIDVADLVHLVSYMFGGGSGQRADGTIRAPAD